MEFTNTARVAAPYERVWPLLTDLEEVARCVPGVEQADRLSENSYRGVMKVKVGPIAIRFEGDIVLEEVSDETGTAHMRAQATDKKVGGAVNARITLKAAAVSPSETEVTVLTEAAILGRMGEFGQPLMKKKAEQIMGEFAANLSKRATSPDVAGAQA